MGNIALWMQVHQLPEVSGLRGFAFAMGFGAIITATLTLTLSLLNWRWLLKPVLTVFFFSAASGAYFMMSYGIVIDSSMITNVIQTDTKEALAHRRRIDHCHRGSSARHLSRLRIHHAQSHSAALFGQSLEQLLRHWHGGRQAFPAQQSNFAAHGA